MPLLNIKWLIYYANTRLHHLKGDAQCEQKKITHRSYVT